VSTIARLPENVQQAASQAEPSTGFGLIPDGIYVLKCNKCVLVKPSKGDPNLNVAEWELQVDQDGVRKAKFWHTVSHSPDAAGLMHGAFDAFGLTLDSEDHEFVGERCLGDIGHEVQQVGKNTGKERNIINALLPLDGAVAAAATSSAPAGGAKSEDPWA
jgi:hypothetical protein